MADSEVTRETYRKLSTLQTLITAGLMFLVVFIVSMSGLMVYTAYTAGKNSAKLENVARETHDALCTLKADIQARHEASVEFLKKNPDGIPGISAEQIEQSQESQEATLIALTILDCTDG